MGTSAGISLLCLGRFIFKKEHYAFWVGIAFWLSSLIDLAYLLALQQILPGLSSPAYLLYLFYLVLLLPCLHFYFGEKIPILLSEARLLKILGWATLLCLLAVGGIIYLEGLLPTLSLEGRTAPLSRLLPFAFFVLYLLGIYLHWEKFKQSQDPLGLYFLGFLAISLWVFPGIIQSRAPYDMAWFSYYLFPTLGCVLFYLALLLEYSDLYRELAETIEHRASTHKLNTLVAGSLSLDEIYQTSSREIQKLVPYDRMVVTLRQERQNSVSVYEESRLPASPVPQGVPVSTEGTATGWVIDHQEVLICDDVLQDSRFPLTQKRYRQVGLRSYVILPLVSKGKILGALNVGSLTPSRYGKEEIEILSPVAEILSLAIENSNLYQETQRREEIQKLLKELSQDIASLDVDSLFRKLTEKVGELLKVDVVDVRVLEGKEWRVRGSSSLQPGIAPGLRTGTSRGRSGWIIKNRRPLALPDITRSEGIPKGETIESQGIRGYLGVPIFSRGGEVIGILRALTYQPREFAQEEVDLLQQLANGAAIAVQNSRLLRELTAKSQEFESANRRLNRLLQEQNALREIFTQINLLDLGHLLHQLTEQALRLLSADHVQVRLLGEDAILRTVALAGEGAGRFQSHLQKMGKGRSTWVMENRTPFTIKNINEDRAFGPGHILRELGVKGYLVVPLISRGQKSIGVLGVSTLTEREFTKEEIALAQQLAAGAAVAIENARLFEEVQKKSEELEDAYKTKSAFLNTMAHELRTPLNVLIATMQLFTDGFYGELTEKQIKGLEPMQRNAVNLLNLIASILDLARLEAKRVPLDIEEFQLKEITDELESSFMPLAKEKGLEMRFQIDDPTLRLKSDKVKVRAILQNLLGNAVKYTDKGAIELSIAARANHRGEGPEAKVISIQVKDTGIGIKEADLPHIFEAFYMAEGVNRRKYPGSGLGLCIVKRLLELLRGTIEAQSEWGKGSTFTAIILADHPDEPPLPN